MNYFCTGPKDVYWFVADRNQFFSERCVVQGNVHLIIKDGVTITCADGIWVPAGSSLNIYAQNNGTGAIYAVGDTNDVAAICGNGGQAGGNIVIHGGNITADAYNDDRGDAAAGIGGGSGGTVLIYGGAVTASGGTDSAGIGGGDGGNGGYVEIHGGSVTATGGDYGAGIGGGDADGDGKQGGTVLIFGGKVIAQGGTDAAGIGGG